MKVKYPELLCGHMKPSKCEKVWPYLVAGVAVLLIVGLSIIEVHG